LERSPDKFVMLGAIGDRPSRPKKSKISVVDEAQQLQQTFNSGLLKLLETVVKKLDE